MHLNTLNNFSQQDSKRYHVYITKVRYMEIDAPTQEVEVTFILNLLRQSLSRWTVIAYAYNAINRFFVSWLNNQQLRHCT